MVGMLVFISDLHLRPGAAARLPRSEQLTRFWQRIEHSRRGERVTLCFVGDLFDVVRSEDWARSPLRPYHAPDAPLAAAVDQLIARTLESEAPFFSALKRRVDSGELDIQYIVGNHDRLLHHAPAARARIRAALGMAGGDAPFPTELRFPEHGVLAYHGHVVDPLCFDPDGGAPLSDMIASELIIRFPHEIRRTLEVDHPHLDDIDDVRPITAVPTWVRTLTRRGDLSTRDQVARVWSGLVEDFLGNGHVKDWFKDHHRKFRVDFPQKVKLLLALSTRRRSGDDSKLSALSELVFRLMDVKFAKAGLKTLERSENRGLRYVVNGHTHFAGMRPLGMLGGKPGCYFNVGTWRPLHQLGSLSPGKPAFLASDAMAYLVFFPKGDPLHRQLEWWQGAAVTE